MPSATKMPESAPVRPIGPVMMPWCSSTFSVPSTNSSIMADRIRAGLPISGVKAGMPASISALASRPTSPKLSKIWSIGNSSGHRLHVRLIHARQVESRRVHRGGGSVEIQAIVDIGPQQPVEYRRRMPRSGFRCIFVARKRPVDVDQVHAAARTVPAARPSPRSPDATASNTAITEPDIAAGSSSFITFCRVCIGLISSPWTPPIRPQRACPGCPLGHHHRDIPVLCLSASARRWK